MSQLPYTKLVKSLDHYEKALSLLNDKRSLSEELILDILLTRDQVQIALKSYNPAPKWSLLRLDRLDKLLKEKANIILNNIDLDHWRTLLNPPSSSWWWFFDQSFDKHWLWNLLSISFLTISAGLVTNISGRFLAGNPDILGSIAIIGQGVLTLITGKTALTLAGKEGAESLLKNFKFIKYSWWNPIRTTLAFVLMSGLILFYYSLPKIAEKYTACGIKELMGKSSQIGLLCNEFFRISQRDDRDYLKNGRRLANAKNNFNRAIKLDPNNMEAYFHLGLYYEKIGDLEKAQGEYEIAAEDGFLKAINNLSRLYILTDQYEKSIILLKDTATDKDIRGKQEEYFFKKNLGWAYLELGNLNKAEANLSRVLKLKEKLLTNGDIQQDPSPYCLMAIFQEKQSQNLSSQEVTYWQQCKYLINDETPEQYQWFTKANQKLTKAQEKGLIP